ncbi:importin subunit alpha [Phtheirospermum japonicum]|uniref:Importin subunit alpha n=1 Tax=Phtheirospermum japonicum TaxID=374723 RepID=A0A830D347_9LAMI|nr:importin subunit alpha [Phtheirospermum japonicum]
MRDDYPQLQALGNISGDSPEYRDIVLNCGALQLMLTLLNECSERSFLRVGLWALSNFLEGKPDVPLEQLEPAIPILSSLILTNDEVVLKEACWALLYLSQCGGEIGSAMYGAGVCSKLAKLYKRAHLSMLLPTIRTVTSIVEGIKTLGEDGYLLDASSHILYSPLLCEIPLPGFKRYRICVSQYEVKERQLLRYLCYVLGIKFIEKLTKKVTHLLCKFADGDKYEASCRWGFTLKSSPPKIGKKDYILLVNEETYSLICSKRARVLRNDSMKRSVSCESTIDNSLNVKNPIEYNVTENSGDVSIVPDVAAAIEDLLEQISKLVSDDPRSEVSGDKRLP